MTSLATRLTAGSDAYKAGTAMLFLAAATILGALAFEHIGGYIPCPLCLEQRYAYYAGVPLLFASLVLLSADQKPWAALIFLAVALFFLVNAGLGVYQAGAEWKFWPGPTTCATVQAVTGSATDLLKKLETTSVIRCDEAAWRFVGLSFAGWNVVVSLVLFVGCLKAALSAAPQKT
jgi:disulfide bond formation protein DsbB